MKNIFNLKAESKAKTDFSSQNSEYSQYKIGNWTYGRPAVLSWGEGSVLKIGSFSSIAGEVTILLGGEHRTDWVTTYPFSVYFEEGKNIKGHPKSKGDVIIGSDVWIGRGATILSGVTIGDGAVIAAESVVTKNIPPYAIFGGNPAKLLRYRFPESQRKKLLKIAWWNWPINRVKAAIPLLLSEKITEFISKYESEEG